MILNDDDRRLLRRTHIKWEDREVHHWRLRAENAEKSLVWVGIGLIFASAALVIGIALWIAKGSS